MQAVAGAAKVKWNKVSGKYLATAHEGEVKLWDTRTSRSPIQVNLLLLFAQTIGVY